MPESLPPDRDAIVLLLLAIAGCVDAVGVSETAHYFVSYMSGNTTELGMLLASRDYAAALLPLGIVVLFVAGATLGALIAGSAGRRAAAVLLLVEAGLLALAWKGLGSLRPMLGVIAMPVAMGLANIVTLRHGAASPGTTYTTGVLVRIGVTLAGLGRDTQPREVLKLVAMWAALLAGSLFGAIGHARWGADVLLVPVALLLILGLVLAALPRRTA